MGRIIERMVRWVVFSAILALVPLVFSVFRVAARNEQMSLEESVTFVLLGGELFLIGAILCGSGLGELVGDRYRFLLPKTLLAGFMLSILLFSAMSFADVTALQFSGEPVNARFVQRSAWLVYASAVISSTCSVGMSEV